MALRRPSYAPMLSLELKSPSSPSRRSSRPSMANQPLRRQKSKVLDIGVGVAHELHYAGFGAEVVEVPAAGKGGEKEGKEGRAEEMAATTGRGEGRAKEVVRWRILERDWRRARRSDER